MSYIWASTFSRDERMYGLGDVPVQDYQGAQIKINDRWHLEWISGLGSMLLGYKDPDFTEAIHKVDPAVTGLTLESEYRVAELLESKLGDVIKAWAGLPLGVRFGLSGTDVTTMAIRLAKAVTSRSLVLKTGYHGWADWSIADQPPAYGVGVDAKIHLKHVEFGDTETLWKYGNIAAIIIENPAWSPDPNYYREVRRWCDTTGALLIMDEIVTGFRYGIGGASQMYGVAPDLVCIGKGLGNGVPVSALVGYKDYMDRFGVSDDFDGPVFCSSTYFGNSMSMAAAEYMLTNWGSDDTAHIWEIGESMLAGLRNAGLNMLGHGARFVPIWDSRAEQGFFIKGMFDRGIHCNRPWLPNLAHSHKDVEVTIQAAREVWSERNDLSDDELLIMAGALPVVLFKNR